jgi:hypothetical protein
MDWFVNAQKEDVVMKIKLLLSSTASLLIIIQTNICIAQPQMSVTRSAGGGPSASDLASEIADPNSQYTIGSASVAINNANGATTDLRAIGEFSNGNVAAIKRSSSVCKNVCLI